MQNEPRERAADAHATVVYIYIYIYTIIGRSLVNICKGLEPRKCRSMNACSRSFFCQITVGLATRT